MKTAIKILLGIASIFAAVAGWHAIAPHSWCWLTQDQLAACIACAALFFFLNNPDLLRNMRTPKRTRATVSQFATSQDCKNARARYKRKNRTAQLKRTITSLTARLGYIVQFATETIKELNETGKSKLGHRRTLEAIKERASGSGITPLPHITAEEKKLLRELLKAGELAEKTARAMFPTSSKISEFYDRKAAICNQLKTKFDL